jgi:SET domain-containing protein
MTRLSYAPGDYAVAVKRSRTGLGLYAEQDIPKNACIIEYVGVPLTKEEEDKSNSRYMFEISARKTIDGAPRWNTARYINHSCRPNCEPNIYKSRIYIHARRKIKAGEELNYDYGSAYFKQFLKGRCLCPKCVPVAAPKATAVQKRAAAARVSSKRKSAKVTKVASATKKVVKGAGKAKKKKRA